jgi:hypothetical protein
MLDVSTGRYQQLLERLPKGGRERLVSSLGRTQAGTSIDLRSPLFAKDRSRDSIAEEMVAKVGFTEFERLTEIEKHELDKWGPFSKVPPFPERRESLKEYWSQGGDPDLDSLSKAEERVKSLIRAGSLRPTALSTARDRLPSNTSLGAPWFTSDRKYVGDYYQRAAQAKDPEDCYPCFILQRGTPMSRTETKVRNVWAIDHMEPILGGTVMYPIMESLRLLPGFSAWVHPNNVDKEATRILQKAGGRRILSSDYEHFDASVPRFLLDSADRIFKYWFVASVHGRIDLLGEIFATVPIIVPYEIWSDRNGGIPSGSIFTSVKGTIVNLLAGLYYGYRSGTEVLDFMCLGDDSVFLYDDDSVIDNVSELASELGLTMNQDKQYVDTESLHYLQRWHSSKYVINGICKGVHSPYRTMNGMLSYEYWREFGGNRKRFFDTTRWITQSEGCVNHPFFEERWVPFWYSGDSNLTSGVDPYTSMQLAGGPSQVREDLKIASYPFNQRDPDKLGEFETVRVVRILQRSAS